MTNPLLQPLAMPNFAAFRPEDVAPVVGELLDALEAELSALEAAPPAGYATARHIESIELRLGHAWRLVSHFLGVQNTPALREAQAQVQPRVVAFSIRLGQSRPIYDALVKAREADDLDSAQRRVLDGLILAAKNAGIELEGEAQTRFNAIQTRLAELGTTFANNVLDATGAWAHEISDPAEVAGLPQSALGLLAQSAAQAGNEGATAEAGPWRVTLAIPSVMAVFKHAAHRGLRERVYRAYTTRASTGETDNQPLIDEILALRAEMSQLLGYPHYAAYSLSTKMAADTDAVFDLLERVRTAAWEPALRELDEVKAFAKEAGLEGDLQLWDAAYYAERMREARFDYSEEELRPYFPIERVLDGLFDIIRRVFGVSMVRDTEGVAGWHEDVSFYRLIDPDGTERAGVFLDPYARPADKRPGAWMENARPRYVADRGTDAEHVVTPLAYVACNFSPPIGGKPAQLTFNEVTTLFHEFGHALQHMLTEVDESMVGGVDGIEWDAVEIASMFMEEWCYVPSVVRAMTAHVDTGEAIPEALMQKVFDARVYRAGSFLLRQLDFGMTDMTLHSTFDPAGDMTPHDVQREIQLKTKPLPALPEERFLCAFQHIFASSYAAGYYSYMWANVMAADAFGAFVEAGLDDEDAIAATGKRLRETLYASGGAEHPSDVFRAFRGREPEVAPMLERLGLSG